MLDDFTGPFEKLNGLQKPLPGKVTGTGTVGYLLNHASNDTFVAINQLLAAGEDLSWVRGGAQAGAISLPPSRRRGRSWTSSRLIKGSS